MQFMHKLTPNNRWSESFKKHRKVLKVIKSWEINKYSLNIRISKKGFSDANQWVTSLRNLTAMMIYLNAAKQLINNQWIWDCFLLTLKVAMSREYSSDFFNVYNKKAGKYILQWDLETISKYRKGMLLSYDHSPLKVIFRMI